MIFFPDLGIHDMSPDILIVREGEAYRLLHGHLRLANVLRADGEIVVEVAGEGAVKVIRTSGDYLVGRGEQRLPLLRN
jgi:hypothetical protein